MALSVIFEPVLHGGKAKVTPYWLILFSVTATTIGGNKNTLYNLYTRKKICGTW